MEWQRKRWRMVMLMLLIFILLLFTSIGISGCGSYRSAPFVNVTVVEQPADDEVAIRRSPPPRPLRRY